MKTSDHAVRCADGATLPATCHEPERTEAVLVLASGMGIPRRFYGRFAADLAGGGVAVITFDYRGIGEAAAAAPDPRTVCFQDWGRLDLHAVLEHAFARHPGVPVFLLGHSAGAQVVGLTPLAERLAGLVFVAGSRPHLRYDRGTFRIFAALWWYGFVPLGSLGRWFPARRLGFSAVDVPAGVTREWGRWARSPRYLFSPAHGIDVSRYARLRQPLLAYSFSDDDYAPRGSAGALLSEYPGARVEHRHVRPVDVGAKAIGHLGFFREASRATLWRETTGWIRAIAAAPEAPAAPAARSAA